MPSNLPPIISVQGVAEITAIESNIQSKIFLKLKR